LIPTLQKAGEEVSARLGWGRGVDQLGNGQTLGDRAVRASRSPRGEGPPGRGGA
jgi:hypothetical protein